VNIQSDLKKLLAGSRKAATSVSDGLQELRLRRLRLLDERDEIAARPVPKAEAFAALDRDLDELVAIAMRETNVRSLTRAENPSWSIPPNGVLLGLLIGANRATFRDQLAEMLAPAYSSGTKPISAEEREAALRRLDEDLLDLEVAEEAAIRSAEAAGLSVLRRADAHPRAVLASDAELG
jgi:hypothetical protein